MSVVASNGTYDVFKGDLAVYDEIPAGVYKIVCNPMTGFHLNKYDGFPKVGKTYGGRDDKVRKIIDMYLRRDKSLGVILEGNKGMGKTLFARMLAWRAVDAGIPVILVMGNWDGVSDYLMSIEQDAMILFDEFEKTFDYRDSEHGDSQEDLLPLFDGLSSFRHLNVVTSNSMESLNSFLINRPGRFHYNIRFSYPTADEVRTFLEDKIPEEAYNAIDDVIAFSIKFPLNYDCLNAIAEELSVFPSVPFKDIISDLNIINYRSDGSGEYKFVFKWASDDTEPLIVKSYVSDAATAGYYTVDVSREDMEQAGLLEPSDEYDDDDVDDIFIKIPVSKIARTRGNSKLTVTDAVTLKRVLACFNKAKWAVPKISNITIEPARVDDYGFGQGASIVYSTVG